MNLLEQIVCFKVNVLGMLAVLDNTQPSRRGLYILQVRQELGLDLGPLRLQNEHAVDLNVWLKEVLPHGLGQLFALEGIDYYVLEFVPEVDGAQTYLQVLRTCTVNQQLKEDA